MKSSGEKDYRTVPKHSNAFYPTNEENIDDICKNGLSSKYEVPDPFDNLNSYAAYPQYAIYQNEINLNHELYDPELKEIGSLKSKKSEKLVDYVKMEIEYEETFKKLYDSYFMRFKQDETDPSYFPCDDKLDCSTADMVSNK